MKFLKITLLLTFLMAISTGFAQKKEVQIKVNKVTDNVYVLIGQGGNIAISVGEDGVFHD